MCNDQIDGLVQDCSISSALAGLIEYLDICWTIYLYNLITCRPKFIYSHIYSMLDVYYNMDHLWHFMQTQQKLFILYQIENQFFTTCSNFKHGYIKKFYWSSPGPSTDNFSQSLFMEWILNTTWLLFCRRYFHKTFCWKFIDVFWSEVCSQALSWQFKPWFQCWCVWYIAFRGTSLALGHWSGTTAEWDLTHVHALVLLCCVLLAVWTLMA